MPTVVCRMEGPRPVYFAGRLIADATSSGFIVRAEGTTDLARAMVFADWAAAKRAAHQLDALEDAESWWCHHYDPPAASAPPRSGLDQFRRAVEASAILPVQLNVPPPGVTRIVFRDEAAPADPVREQVERAAAAPAPTVAFARRIARVAIDLCRRLGAKVGARLIGGRRP